MISDTFDVYDLNNRTTSNAFLINIQANCALDFLTPAAFGLCSLRGLTNLRVEEDLRPQEALVANIDGELLLADGVDAGVLLDPLGAVCVVLVELFN